jgi:aspartate ammonia-lyase
MTLGQEFSTYAVMLGEDEQRLAEAGTLIREINLGATAIGTGINAHPDYAPLVTRRLSEISGVPLVLSPNLVEATQEVIGNDVTVTMAAEAGQLQLNAFEPIIAHSLFKSLAHLAAGCRTLNERCVKGVRANAERARRLLDESTALVTALTPFLGYAASTEIAREALETGKRVYDLVLSKSLMTREELDRILRPEALTRPQYSTVTKPGDAP